MPNSDNAAQETEGPKNRNTDEGHLMKWFWNTFFAGRAPAWTAISTVVLMFFSGLLWKVSDKANETSIVTQRAFISFSGPVLAKNTDGKKLKGINVFYVMSNSGTTPARAGISQWNLSLGPTVAQKGLDFDTLSQTERLSFVLGPKVLFQLKPISIPIQDLEMIGEGKRHLFFWGWTTYRDIFPGTPQRLTEFCTEIDSLMWSKVDHTDATVEINTSSPPCPTHNCYDEDCEDYSRRVR
jgi:hypothetical protein